MMRLYRSLIIFGGMLAGASFFWYGEHTGFEGKSALLVTSVEDDSAAETVVGFAHTRQFIDRTIGSTRFQESVWNTRPESEREQALKKHLAVSQVSGGDVIVVTFFDDAEEGAQVASRESVETLLRMAKSYQGEKDLSIRVLDKTYVDPSFQRMYWYGAEILLSALLGTLLLEFLIRIISFVPTLKKWKKKKPFPTFPTPEHFVPEKIDSFRFSPGPETQEELDEIPVLEPEKEKEAEKPSRPSAREQLHNEEYGVPEGGLQSVSMSMEDLPFEFETAETPTENSSKAKAKVSSHVPEEAPLQKGPEPSVLEYKRRLNELMRG